MKLNKIQQEAVVSKNKNMLILAGAGSGKTSVLAHRIAYLCQEKNISPLNILAVTFTNKASKEMHHRVESLLGYSTSGMWIGTFHGIAHRLIRRHYNEIGIEKNFKILDSSDQLSLLKKIAKSLGYDEKYHPVKHFQAFINKKKDQGIRAYKIDSNSEKFEKYFLNMYIAYELRMKADNALDFADLILYAYELIRDNEIVRKHYQDRFKVILIDEFQDTNNIQYLWLKLLSLKNNSTIAVGDDDQSIYGWRGAKIENIFQFKVDYAPIIEIKLEQNYRSTKTILNIANAVIKNNTKRMPKELWSDQNKGNPALIYNATNERDEADYIILEIKKLIKSGVDKSQIAILYRANAQSRLFEEKLLQAQIPYRIHGGVRYFERSEIKDALSYLRLSSNEHDNMAFERIVNVPARGIGLKTIDDIRILAIDENLSLFQAMKKAVDEDLISIRAKNNLLIFKKIINSIKTEFKNKNLKQQIEITLKYSGLLEFYENTKKDKAEQKLENLKELITAGELFEPPLEDLESHEYLAEFLAIAVLESGEVQADESEPSIQLMTLHSAKGLEFDNVFIVGLEEGLFPSNMSQNNPESIDEERRLCYVGITRAKNNLYLCYASIRNQYGMTLYQKPSRFIKEIPQEFIKNVKMTKSTHSKSNFGINTEFFTDKKNTTMYRYGDILLHKKFGVGVFISSEGENDDLIYHIDFKGGYGIKRLLAKMVKLEKVNN